MSKIDYNDVDIDLEILDEVEAVDFDHHASRKHKNRTRRKIENLIERKKLKEMMYTEDSYWGD